MILASNISCKRGNNLIFENLNFKIEDGVATIISGKNGSGKTSLLRILANLLKPKKGDIIWKGKSIYKNIDEYHKELTYIADINCSKENLSVYENMKFWKNLYKSSISNDLFLKLLSNIDLDNYINERVKNLSSGQKRKLELTRLIIEERHTWILDEPFLGLDQHSVSIIGQTISDHLKQKGTVILSSHIPVNITNKTYIDLDLHESN
ncbi:MAG: Cytochrome c biogenesis ATP-binding export protein CcmA [Alphaproteobacteria bacterium MarineAlpha5_Bin12]|nr:MAG: Cytochrome c biogenesis ATP-binding export protein CcmA [Alphaproteobacteria bacterium MarineAlpha5_Bin12]|tara:strand:+ start:2738 stop:3361 length:624 start_codon:yes stop_codon:yes gene_type:complete